MKITYDKVSSAYQYPLSKKDLKVLEKIVDPDVMKLISAIRFGCNTKTNQEGRLVKRGAAYSIRINFCLHNHSSYAVPGNKKDIRQIESFGGEIDFDKKQIRWKLYDAKRYALFILFHEIGHITYCESKYNGSIKESLQRRGSVEEDMWCDDFAMKSVHKCPPL